MKNYYYIIFLALIFFLLSSMVPKFIKKTADLNLEDGFRNPPMQARPQTWWHWMNGHVTKEGITCDLEAMKNAGLGGFTLFNASEGIPEGPVRYMSDEWWSLISHTIKESARLGLEMGIHNGAGWATSGGPWITPDKSMQEVVWTEKTVQGPCIFDGLLETPEPALGIERDMKRDSTINKRYYVDRDKVRGYYNDIVLLAFPTLKGDQQQDVYRLDDWWGKAGFSKLSEYMPQSQMAPKSECIDLERIIDLTPLLDIDGRLRWEVPHGNWTLLRLGYQPTGRQNHPAPPDGRGLEIDKQSAAATDFFWKNSISKIVHISGEHTGTTFKRILIDSYEAGHQNWNRSFLSNFTQRRGYDPTFYLPALTGRIIGDVETTERFLWDFRKTLGEVITENYYGRFAELCKQSNLLFASEGYGKYGNTDDYTASAQPDIPMAEWWIYNSSSYHAATAKLASSIAQTYNRKIVDSEAFTGPGARIFEEYPYAFKALGDYFFCQGITRFSYHTFAHDPYMVPPGLGLGSNGSRFDSRNTWWPYVSAYLNYVARCQYLFQQGSAVADLLYYVGEDTPKQGKMRNELQPYPPDGFDYFFANQEIFNRLDVKDGKLILPEGMTYRILILPPQKRMSLHEVQKIKELVEKGATVIGLKPDKINGLIRKSDEETRMHYIAEKIWQPNNKNSDHCNRFENGKVYQGDSISELLKELQLSPDFEYKLLKGSDRGETSFPGDGIEFKHQIIDGNDFYFVSNQHHHRKVVEAVFRIEGRLPELWHPDEGVIEKAAMFRVLPDGRMAVTLTLDPAGSVFVVFRKMLDINDEGFSLDKDGVPAFEKLFWNGENLYLQTFETGDFVVKSSREQVKKVSIETIPESIELKGPWNVHFSGGLDAPFQVEMPKLISWAEHEQDDVKYFSGTATYSITFDVLPQMLSENYRVKLDLGAIHVIGRVILNGNNLGVVWKEPYVIDVTSALIQEENVLEIQVANLWVNRLIGDQRYPDDMDWTSNTGSTARGLGLRRIPDWVVKGTPRPVRQRKTFTAWKWPHLEKKELVPSGLIGPVRIVPVVIAQVNFSDTR